MRERDKDDKKRRSHLGHSNALNNLEDRRANNNEDEQSQEPGTDGRFRFHLFR